MPLFDALCLVAAHISVAMILHSAHGYDSGDFISPYTLDRTRVNIAAIAPKISFNLSNCFAF